jgi:galactokinase/mevalonate kinase-like predicted kinase
LAALDGMARTVGGQRHRGQIEIKACKKSIGKQDQYTAAYGGLNLLGFTSKGVTVEPVACDLAALSAHCLLLDTGLHAQATPARCWLGSSRIVMMCASWHG